METNRMTKLIHARARPHIYIYIYIERERERERDKGIRYWIYSITGTN